MDAAAALPCSENDRACAGNAARSHAVRRIESWKGALDKPLDRRVADAPAGMVEYLTLDNIANGYAERPRAPSVDADFRRDLAAALASLPPEVTRLAARKVAGILLVDDLGGTGYTDEITDDTGSPVAAFVVLDAGVLGRRRGNEWITWRESSPFTKSTSRKLVAHIAGHAADTRATAIRYILLHELAHAISVGSGIHPRWTRPLHGVRLEDYPFASVSWRIRDERYVPAPGEDFPARDRVVYYFGPRLTTADMAPAYRALEGTRFPTLYAATSPGDDFAESFANYVHVVMLRQPFAIDIVEEDHTAYSYRPCWTAPRCAEKRRLLESLLGLGPDGTSRPTH